MQTAWDALQQTPSQDYEITAKAMINSRARQKSAFSRCLLAVVAAVFVMALGQSAASAASFVVGTVSDDGALDTCSAVSSPNCSLRGAIILANQDEDADEITFGGPGVIELDSPLPDVTEQLTIDATGQAVVVTASGSYPSAGDDYAIDITDPDASPTFVKQLPFYGVYGRAIRSNVPSPTIRVGPRRSNGVVPIDGASGSLSSVDLFRVTGGATHGEASSFFAGASVGGGAFSYVPVPTPAPGEQFSAQGFGPGGSSNFSGAAATPSDLTSPALLRAVGNSNSSVRLDFSEAISPGSATAGAFGLWVANVARPVVSTLVHGNSVYLYTNVPWQTGEAGSVALTGGVRVTDYPGNQVLGEPHAFVFAGPGEVKPPAVTKLRFWRQRFCKYKRRTCRRDYTYAYISLEKKSRVIFRVYKGQSKRRHLVTFIRRLKAGRTKLKIRSVINGRRLPATAMTLSATAQDSARTLSPPGDAIFRVVKHKRNL